MPRIPLAVLLLWLLAPGAATAAPRELIVYAAARCDQQGDLGPNVPTFDGSPRSCDSELWTVRPDGTDDRQLTFNGVADSDPAWSPDGLRLAVARGVPEDHGFTRIHVIGADGSGSTQISHGFDANGVSTPDGGTSSGRRSRRRARELRSPATPAGTTTQSGSGRRASGSSRPSAAWRSR